VYQVNVVVPLDLAPGTQNLAWWRGFGGAGELLVGGGEEKEGQASTRSSNAARLPKPFNVDPAGVPHPKDFERPAVPFHNHQVLEFDSEVADALCPTWFESKTRSHTVRVPNSHAHCLDSSAGSHRCPYPPHSAGSYAPGGLSSWKRDSLGVRAQPQG
jgi:hypothetical protein